MKFVQKCNGRFPVWSRGNHVRLQDSYVIYFEVLNRTALLIESWKNPAIQITVFCQASPVHHHPFTPP